MQKYKPWRQTGMCTASISTRSKGATWHPCGVLKTALFPEKSCKDAKSAKDATDYFTFPLFAFFTVTLSIFTLLILHFVFCTLHFQIRIPPSDFRTALCRTP
jgi:hypothetical protein